MRLLLSALVVSVLVLAGCASQVVPDAKDLRRLRTVEVVVQVPSDNFVYQYTPTTVHAQAPAGVSTGAGVGMGLVANILISVVDRSKAEADIEALQPVRASVARLDLRSLAMRELASIERAPGSPRVIPSLRPFPNVNPLQYQQVVQAISQPLQSAEADAALYVSILPVFFNEAGLVTLYGSTWLVDRSGKVIASTSVTFTGPYDRDRSRAELSQWWSDGRYRRHIIHGVRASLAPAIDQFLNPLDDLQRAKLDVLRSRIPTLTPNAHRLRTTPCALESDTSPVVYRFERNSHSLNAIAHCDGERIELFDPAASPELSWTTDRQPPVQ